MIRSRYLTRFIALLVVLILASSLSSMLVAGQEAAPGAPDADPIIYLPLVQTAPSTISGRVTDGGAAAPGVELALHFYDGVAWTHVLSSTTNTNGDYAFNGMRSLLPDQKYKVKYSNPGDNPARLWTWETRELTSFTAGNVVSLGSFDIANVGLSSPASGSEIVPPRLFQWVRRAATSGDSYQFILFNNDDRTLAFNSPALGYVSSYTLSSRPSAIQYCNPYFWGVKVNNPDGGWGLSFRGNVLTLHQNALSGIHGCVTEGGAPVSGIPVTLWRNDHPGLTNMGTVNSVNGTFQFTGKGRLNPGQSYLVDYSNVDDGPSRLEEYKTRELASYIYNTSVHIGDFDIANIWLSSPPPDAAIPPPYNFYWVPRPAAPTDSYAFSLFDAADSSPTFTSGPILGYVTNYNLTDLPGGFSYNQPYGWTLWVADPFGGSGFAYYYRTVTFLSTGIRAASLEGAGELRWDRQLMESPR